MNYTIDDFQVGDILFSKHWKCEYEVLEISGLNLVMKAKMPFVSPIEWNGYLRMSKDKNAIQIKKPLKKEERILAKIALIEKRWKER